MGDVEYLTAFRLVPVSFSKCQIEVIGWNLPALEYSSLDNQKNDPWWNWLKVNISYYIVSADLFYFTFF